MGKTTSFDIDFTFTALGSCTNTLTFNLPVASNTSASVSGKEATGSAVMAGCFTLGSAAMSCTKVGGANFVNGERYIFSGVYENQ
jgi:hypothetical protein